MKRFLLLLILGCGGLDDIDELGQELPAEGKCDPECGPCPGSPIIVDVLNNGFKFSNLANGVMFDLQPGGILERVSWTVANGDDAWLTVDLNQNGLIDNGSELFGNFTMQILDPVVPRNGYRALKIHDSNNDGWVSPQDLTWRQLRLWTDKNHNGVSEANEFATPDSVGITGFRYTELTYRKLDQYGNYFRYAADLRKAPGSTVNPRTYDVFLLTSTPPAKAMLRPVCPAPPIDPIASLGCRADAYLKPFPWLPNADIPSAYCRTDNKSPWATNYNWPSGPWPHFVWGGAILTDNLSDLLSSYYIIEAAAISDANKNRGWTSNWNMIPPRGTYCEPTDAGGRPNYVVKAATAYCAFGVTGVGLADDMDNYILHPPTYY